MRKRGLDHYAFIRLSKRREAGGTLPAGSGRERLAWNESEMADAVAAESVARAGYSEHNTGLAVDLNGVLETFDETPEYRWLQRHAHEYGFVLRYPEDKK